METYLTRITDYLFAQSWQIAVLMVAVAAAAFALRNRSAHIRYLLWLIVLAKCLVPPLYSVPLGVLPAQSRIAQPSADRLSETEAEAGEPLLASETRRAPAVDAMPAESTKETPSKKFEILNSKF